LGTVSRVLAITTVEMANMIGQIHDLPNAA